MTLQMIPLVWHHLLSRPFDFTLGKKQVIAVSTNVAILKANGKNTRITNLTLKL
jgi:hypothetical protein